MKKMRLPLSCLALAVALGLSACAGLQAPEQEAATEQEALEVAKMPEAPGATEEEKIETARQIAVIENDSPCVTGVCGPAPPVPEDNWGEGIPDEDDQAFQRILDAEAALGQEQVIDE